MEDNIMSELELDETESKESKRAYINVNNKLRIRVIDLCFIVEHYKGIKNDKPNWGDYKYYTSWDGVFGYILKRLGKDAVIDKGEVSILEARKIIVKTTNDMKDLFLSELNKFISSADEELLKNIKKFNK